MKQVHTGQLHRDSPGLFKELKRSYDERAQRYLSTCYRESSLWGGLREPLIEREAEITFNPAPARISNILLKETKDVTVFSLSVALLSTVPVTFHPRIARTYTQQKNILPILYEPENCNHCIQNILFAKTLDFARRLHLTRLNQAEKIQEYQRIEQDLITWNAVFLRADNESLFLLLNQWLQHARSKYS